jgi:hypothetical protein
LYEQVGGYRSAFYFAQDLDLWVRFAERGDHLVMPDVLYQASFNTAAISALYRKEQVETAKLILECARLRREGLTEDEPLEQATRIRPGPRRRPGRLARARALYFLGTCLSRNNAEEASRYFKQSLLAWPLHLKSAARLILR